MDEYFRNLTFRDGIYLSAETSSVNYPRSGNDTFFSVEDHSFWYKHRNDCIIQAVSLFHKSGKIFEIGGGNGYVAKALQDSGIDVVVIEPDHSGIQNAKSRGVKNLICSSFSDLEWAGKPMENAALFDVLEHIEDDLQFLTQLNNHIEKDGLLLLTVPGYNFLYSLEDEHDGHFRRYTLKDLAEKLNLSGFKIIYKTYFFSYLPLPVFLFKTLPGKLKLGKYKSIDEYNKLQSPASYQQEHTINNRLINGALTIYHKSELKLIRNRRMIPFGASCLIIAKRV